MNIAIVTGASSGLGTEFVKEAVKMYPNLDEIWLIARRAERLEKLSESITTVKCVVPLIYPPTRDIKPSLKNSAKQSLT